MFKLSKQIIEKNLQEFDEEQEKKQKKAAIETKVEIK